MQTDPDVGYAELVRPSDRVSAPLTVESIAGFLELSVGLSAWKAMGASRWSLRMNPSSGNLHPTETHLVLPAAAPLPSGVYHYVPLTHELELRAGIPDRLWELIRSHLNTAGFLVALSSIFWRESWKYGERAFRYCHLDVGHALAALSFSAGIFGWRLVYLNTLADRQIDTVLGFDKTAWHPQEAEHADLMCLVRTDPRCDRPVNFSEAVAAGFSELAYQGAPNRLSKERFDWPVIDQVAHRSEKPQTPAREFHRVAGADWRGAETTLTAAQVIRRRRSATAFDRHASMDKPVFLTLLDRTRPRSGVCPFNAGLSDPMVHLLVFVHNVNGLNPGLYFFFRHETDMGEIRRLTKPEFSWEPAEKHTPLFLLKTGDVRFRAMELSCNQEIAGFSAFSLGMIARFRQPVAREPFRYRQLYWECGMIGQVLYLEAEAHGFRGTGIGCFFDDPVHEVLGFTDDTYQSLYHFTVGVPEADSKLITLPPYAHLAG